MVKYARRTYGLEVLTGDLLTLPIRRTFDVITLNNVLEHLYEPRLILAKVHRLQTPRTAGYRRPQHRVSKPHSFRSPLVSSSAWSPCLSFFSCFTSQARYL